MKYAEDLGPWRVWYALRVYVEGHPQGPPGQEAIEDMTGHVVRRPDDGQEFEVKDEVDRLLIEEGIALEALYAMLDVPMSKATRMAMAPLIAKARGALLGESWVEATRTGPRPKLP